MGLVGHADLLTVLAKQQGLSSLQPPAAVVAPVLDQQLLAELRDQGLPARLRDRSGVSEQPPDADPAEHQPQQTHKQSTDEDYAERARRGSP